MYTDLCSTNFLPLCIEVCPPSFQHLANILLNIKNPCHKQAVYAQCKFLRGRGDVDKRVKIKLRLLAKLYGDLSVLQQSYGQGCEQD